MARTNDKDCKFNSFAKMMAVAGDLVAAADDYVPRREHPSYAMRYINYSVELRPCTHARSFHRTFYRQARDRYKEVIIPQSEGSKALLGEFHCLVDWWNSFPDVK